MAANITLAGLTSRVRESADLEALFSLLPLEVVTRPGALLYTAAALLLATAFFQRYAFTRPPRVPLKRLPRRPTLQVTFKPDRLGEAQSLAAAPAVANPAAPLPPRPPPPGSGWEKQPADPIRLAGEEYSPVPPIKRRAGLRGWDGPDSFVPDRDWDRDADTATTSDETAGGSSGRASASSVAHSASRTDALPDSFAPLLSSSIMEVARHQVTPDLLHAVQAEGGVRLREGRHDLPLNKDPSRPQLVLAVGREGCRISVRAAVGSDGLSEDEDLDVGRPTTSRSCPMVKHAGITLDPPLPLANVAPTLVHIPTLFEDNMVPSMRRIQIVRYLLDLVGLMSFFLEKILWIVESKCQIHLSKVRVTPFYKGDWRLSLSFSGHLLVFGWIPIPFIGVTLPAFIIPQPHALLEKLLTAQPLASAKIRRENIEEQRIALALTRTVESWHCSTSAVATPPAVGVDLTAPGGLTVALEMMHGRDLFAGVRRQQEGQGLSPTPGAAGSGEQAAPANITMPRNLSGDTLSSWASQGDGTNQGSSAAARRRNGFGTASAPLPQRGGPVAPAAVPATETFDANQLVPWLFELSAKGRVDADKVSVAVTKLSLTHESVASSHATSSWLSMTGSIVLSKANPRVPALSSSPIASPIKSLAQTRRLSSDLHFNSLAGSSDSPSVCEILLFSDQSSSTASYSKRLAHLLAYDYAFDIADDTHLDAISLSIGADHHMLKGDTIITTVVESIYAHGSLSAREGAMFDATEKRKKRNILRHLPAVDFTAGIQNIFIPEGSMSYSDDGQTKCFPELKGGKMKIRITGGFMDDASTRRDFNDETDSVDFVSDGIKVVTDFSASSFVLNNETNIHEFPELEIMESIMSVVLSGTFGGSIATYLRPQSLGSSTSAKGPNVLNPLEAYEIDFSGSNLSLKLKEGHATLGHRRVIVPSETSFALKIVDSVVDMSLEGETECELSWDFQGSSPILQVVGVGQHPRYAAHENRRQAEILIRDLRQGRFNLQVSPVGGMSINKAVTSREDREGLYDWKFFNALVDPDGENSSRLMQVIHDKKTMKQLLKVVKLINFDLERLAYFALTRAWRAKDIMDKEGMTDPGKIIPGHRMARLMSLFLGGDLRHVEEILPIIERATAGEGLDIVKVKDLLRSTVEAYDDWAPEIDRIARWIDVCLSPQDAEKPYILHEVPPLSELRCYSSFFNGIPSAKEIYSTLLEKQQLPLDPSFSTLVGKVAPYMSLSQIEFVLTSRKRPSDWQPKDLRRLRYVYSIKKKVEGISESYGGLSFLPQSFFVSIYIGEATRASLRASSHCLEKSADSVRDEPVSWPSEQFRRTSTLSRLRGRRMNAPQVSYVRDDSAQFSSGGGNSNENFLSPAARVASMKNLAQRKSARNGRPVTADKDQVGAESSTQFDLGDSLLGPQDVAILFQAGLTSSMKGSTVVQLNQRMLLDLMASQPSTFAVAVLAEIGTPGGHGSPRSLTSALMALLELDQSSFTRFHRIDMHALLESWLPGFKIPRRDDYLAGGRWARQSYYESLFGVAKSILEDAEMYMALKGHIQRVRHNKESDPMPLAKELETHSDSIGIDIDSSNGDLTAKPTTKLMETSDRARRSIAAADAQGRLALKDIKQSPHSSVEEIESCQKATELYREAFDACSAVLILDKLAFQADWFKSFFRRNYDALMIKSVYDNVVEDTDNVRDWMDGLMRGDKNLKDASSHHRRGASGNEEDLVGERKTPMHAPLLSPLPQPLRELSETLMHHIPFIPNDLPVFAPRGNRDDNEEDEAGFFSKPTDRTEQEIIDGIIDVLFFQEEEKDALRSDPLVRLLIANFPGEYDFTIVTAFGVITEGEKGLELADALKRLEDKRGVKAIRSNTGTARSFEFNASKIEEGIEKAVQLGKPFGLLGYSQGCANALMAESLLLSGSPDQQKMINSTGKGLVCRQMLFSAANGSMHGPSSDAKVQRLITMAEAFFKYQQGYFSRAFISTVLELLTGAMDSSGFQKFIGGTQAFLPDGNRAFWREAQNLPHVPTTVLRGVLEAHTTPESLDMTSNLLTKQSGSALHDSQVHVYDAVGHPVYTINRNGKLLEKSDMGGAVQRTNHWSPLDQEVAFVKTKRDVGQAVFECAKDRHVMPWVDVNARFGFIQYVPEWVSLSKSKSDCAECDEEGYDCS